MATVQVVTGTKLGPIQSVFARPVEVCSHTNQIIELVRLLYAPKQLDIVDTALEVVEPDQGDAPSPDLKMASASYQGDDKIVIAVNLAMGDEVADLNIALQGACLTLPAAHGLPRLVPAPQPQHFVEEDKEIAHGVYNLLTTIGAVKDVARAMPHRIRTREDKIVASLLGMAHEISATDVREGRMGSLFHVGQFAEVVTWGTAEQVARYYEDVARVYHPSTMTLLDMAKAAFAHDILGVDGFRAACEEMFRGFGVTGWTLANRGLLV